MKKLRRFPDIRKSCTGTTLLSISSDTCNSRNCDQIYCLSSLIAISLQIFHSQHCSLFLCFLAYEFVCNFKVSASSALEEISVMGTLDQMNPRGSNSPNCSTHPKPLRLAFSQSWKSRAKRMSQPLLLFIQLCWSGSKKA